MTSKEAVMAKESIKRWNSRWLPLVMTVAALAGLFFGARALWKPLAANAQAPRTGAARPGTVNSKPGTPAAGAATRGGTPAAPSGASNARPVVASGANASKAGVAQASATDSTRPVVAVVNGEQITREQLGNECLRRFGGDVLESIVNKHLIWQECQAKGITITEKDVDDEVTRTAANWGLSTDRYLAMLRDERGISPDQYRREIVWPMIALRRLAAGQIDVTREELQQAFESKYGPQVKVRLIAVSTPDRASQIHREVTANPEKFGDIAKEKSEDPNSAASRGQIPPICKHLGDPAVERAAFSLKEGQISPVIHAANQYLILKCEKQIAETYVTSAQMKQIEKQLTDQIRDNKMREAAANMFQRMQQQAKVVNVFNDAKLSQEMPGIAATINNQRITIQQLMEDCLQRHGSEVLEGEINRRLLEQELRRHSKTVTQRDLDIEIARAADSYGFTRQDGTPDVNGWLKAVTETEQVSVDLYVRDSVWPSVALKSIVGNKVEVTQEDMKKGFESNYGERVEILAIVLNSQRQASQVWDLARGDPSDRMFGELAQQHSVEPVSRANFGKVPPIRRYGGQPVLEEEAFKLKPGEISGIIAVGDKFVIMRCLGRTKPVVSDFHAVEDELRKDIEEKKLRLSMAQEFDRIRESAQIDNFLAGTTQAGKRVASRAAPPTKAAPVSNTKTR